MTQVCSFLVIKMDILHLLSKLLPITFITYMLITPIHSLNEVYGSLNPYSAFENFQVANPHTQPQVYDPAVSAYGSLNQQGTSMFVSLHSYIEWRIQCLFSCILGLPNVLYGNVQYGQQTPILPSITSHAKIGGYGFPHDSSSNSSSAEQNTANL